MMNKIKRNESLFTFFNYGFIGGFVFGLLRYHEMSGMGLCQFIICWAATGTGLFIGQLLRKKLFMMTKGGKGMLSRLFISVLGYSLIPALTYFVIMLLATGLSARIIGEALGIGIGFLFAQSCFYVFDLLKHKCHSRK